MTEDARERAIEAATRNQYERTQRQRISAPENLWVPPPWDDLDARTRWKYMKQMAADIASYEAALWQPIETAPKNGKNGTPVLVTIAGGKFHAMSASFDVDTSRWVQSGGRLVLTMEPTHWRPLPDPPKSQ